jgi:hypothetical protein
MEENKTSMPNLAFCIADKELVSDLITMIGNRCTPLTEMPIINQCKLNTTEEDKTSLTNFIKYIRDNKLASTRLLYALGAADGYLTDDFTTEQITDITKISDNMFMRLHNVGKTYLAEFKKLRTDYLHSIFDIPREKYICWMRSDIYETLKTIQGERDFVETALLEKFERDGIVLVVSS